MAEERKLSDDDVIDRETPDYREGMKIMDDVMRIAERLMQTQKPSIAGERYFTTVEIMRQFHISRRALQNYRDNGVIPYTAIGGILLYPESKIQDVLERNYYKINFN